MTSEIEVQAYLSYLEDGGFPQPDMIGKLPKKSKTPLIQQEWVSLGVGIQSTALVILNIEKMIANPVNRAIFADTGSERPETYQYLENVLKPYSAANNFEIVTVNRGDFFEADYHKSLEAYSEKYRIVPSTRTRWCTDKFKIIPMEKWFKAQGIEPVNQIGISTDEAHRAKESPAKRYPLLETGWSREQCAQLILDKLGALPVKSGCFCCPFAGQNYYRKLDKEHPDLLVRSIALEANARSVKNPHERKYLPIWGNLSDFIYNQVLWEKSLWSEEDFLPDNDDDGCNSNWCMR